MVAINKEYSVEEPLNREPPIKQLVSSFITQNGGFERNHGPIPHVDANTHLVHVDGEVSQKLELSISNLKNDFKQYDVTCALQCAGNRRHSMRTLLKEVDGIDWGDGAVMNCKWTGPRLKDVLQKAGLKSSPSQNGHVAFASFQQECQHDSWYGGSVGLERAMRDDGDVILALKMNGDLLTYSHGYPVRAVVPGISGARSVKWLDRITIQSKESQNFYQQRDYKILPPEATDKVAADKYWDSAPPIQDMPANSIISSPLSSDTVRLSGTGTIDIEGYALPKGDQGPVVKVEVSVDEGRTWQKAQISKPVEGVGRWCWVLWKLSVKMSKGKGQKLLSRATDKGGNSQEPHPQWNLRGVGYNGYGESRDVTVV